jgi:hypothetical protein
MSGFWSSTWVYNLTPKIKFLFAPFTKNNEYNIKMYLGNIAVVFGWIMLIGYILFKSKPRTFKEYEYKK